MHVAIVIERIETWRGGAETSTVQFAHHLAEGGCRVTFLTTSPAQSTPDYEVVTIKAPRALRATRTLWFARRAAAYARGADFDVVHSITPCMAADVYQPRGGTIPETLERNLALRPVALRRGLKRLGQKLSLKYRVVARLERRLLTRRPAPHVIAISRYVARQLEEHYRFDARRVHLIFNGVDSDNTPQEQREEDRRSIRKQFGLHDHLVILAVANNFKLKGVGKLIEALAALEGPQRRADSDPLAGGDGETPAARKRRETYLIVTGRDNPAPFIGQARRLGIADRVFFSGPTQRMPAFFHAADVLAHPTYYDPCSRVVLEAMAAGLPVITTAYNGAAELIRDGEEGYVIKAPEDVAALTDRIRRLFDDERRQNCGRLAAQTVGRFTMARHAERVRRLYDELVAKGEIVRGA